MSHQPRIMQNTSVCKHGPLTAWPVLPPPFWELPNDLTVHKVTEVGPRE